MTERHEAERSHRSALAASAASRRTILLSAALGIVCAVVLDRFHLANGHPSTQLLTWWSIAPIAIAAQLLVFDVEVRREVYTFTFSEIPLVLGLFLASPIHLLLGRLLGEAIFLAFRERHALRKKVLNLSSFLAETTMLLAMHRVVGTGTDITRPLDWLGALASVVAADLVGYVVVFRVVRWHGAPITFRQILGVGTLAIPVNTSFALVIGILLVERPWATVLLSGVGAFLMLAYRSYSSLRKRYDSLSLLYDFTRLVSGTQRPDAVLEAMLSQAKDLLRAEYAEIWVRDEGTSMLRLRVDERGRTAGEVADPTASIVDVWFGSHPGASIIGRNDPIRQSAMLAEALDARDCIVAPITESGSVVGLVAVANRLGEITRFDDASRLMFATLANHASVALENGRMIERLHQQARIHEHEVFHDSLTGLPNRVLLTDRLDAALARVADESTGSRGLAVGIMDLDGFKEINDTLGHQSGDAVLVEIARRFTNAVGPATLVARLGGDEFALLVMDDADRLHLERMARRIREEVSRPFVIDGARVNVNVSIGFALSPDDAADASGLLQRADVAMYSAKAGTGNGVDFYDRARDENSTRRLALAAGLHSAIIDGELSVLYQPKALLATGQVVGFEALLRWHHPVFGDVLPEEFIPLAERTSTIIKLTEFVLTEALCEATAWHNNGHAWSIAVNVAMRNLLDDGFVALVERLIAETGCDPELVTLEITETSVMSDTRRTIEVLRQLDALGVTLSVDDFGTGYSSLSYLQQLPVEEIKIDQLFVAAMATDPSAEAIVRSVLDLARNLGLRVVAEGVENAELWSRLQVLDCDVAQGYVLAEPMVAGRISAWANGWQAEHSIMTSMVSRA